MPERAEQGAAPLWRSFTVLVGRLWARTRRREAITSIFNQRKEAEMKRDNHVMGEDEIPAGTFHGEDHVPKGTFH